MGSIRAYLKPLQGGIRDAKVMSLLTFDIIGQNESSDALHAACSFLLRPRERPPGWYKKRIFRDSEDWDIVYYTEVDTVSIVASPLTLVLCNFFGCSEGCPAFQNTLYFRVSKDFCPHQETEIIPPEGSALYSTGFAELFTKGFGEDDSCKINLNALRALRAEMPELAEMSDSAFCSILYYVANPRVAISRELYDTRMESGLANLLQEVYESYTPVVDQLITKSSVTTSQKNNCSVSS